jgi:hypothetical protein
MRRHYDWQLRLEAFARERLSMPFAWGRNDCATFAADAVQAMTGERLLADLRGYADERGAARLIGAAGGLRAIACQALGEPVSPCFARPGDVVLLLAQGRETLGICNGPTVCGPGAEGMLNLPMADAVAAWRV